MLELAPAAVLAPSCPDFPETKYREATVVCEGPGACHASPLELAQACLPGPVVAVNRAIAFSDRIPIDVWASLDDPTALWAWAETQTHPQAKLFSANASPNIWHWRKILGEDAGGRLYTRQPTYMEALAEVEVNGAAPLMPTLFHVLAWLIQVGVKHVRLIGCDMTGTDSPLMETWAPEANEDFQFRWRLERIMLAHTIRQYRARGARLERWHP